MNGHFRIVKGKGIECDGHMHTPPSHWSQADLALAQAWAELAFTAGERNILYEQLHATRVSRQRLNAIVPAVMRDVARPPVRIAEPLT